MIEALKHILITVVILALCFCLFSVVPWLALHLLK